MTETTAISLDAVLDDALAADVAPGIIAIVADRSEVRYERAVGTTADPRDGAPGRQPIGLDSVVRLASMTKLVTTVIVLQLVESGRLALDTPVAQVLPEFEQLMVLEGFDGDRPVLRHPRHAATIGNLLTHTTGLPYTIWDEASLRYESVTGAENIFFGRLAGLEAPLVADPGTRFDYGLAHDWLGRVIERIEDARYDDVVRVRVAEPLGLTDTVAALSTDQRRRAGIVELRSEDGWQPSGIDNVIEPEFYCAGHCLHSTAREFMTLQRTLLNDGTAPNGVRLLEPHTVESMARDQLVGIPLRTMPTTAPVIVNDITFGPDDSWGLGAAVTMRSQPGRRHAGSFGWYGMYNTIYWVDRAAGLAAALYTQTLPFLDPAVRSLFETFERAVYHEYER